MKTVRPMRNRQTQPGAMILFGLFDLSSCHGGVREDGPFVTVRSY
jgi:hypothetical protein